MALPTVVNFDSARNTRTITFAAPSAGNILLAFCAFGVANTAPATPAGWEEVDQFGQTGANGLKSRQVIKKLSDGTESSVTFSSPSTRPVVAYVEIATGDFALIGRSTNNFPATDGNLLEVSGVANADETLLIGFATTHGSTTLKSEFNPLPPAAQILEEQDTGAPIQWVIGNLTQDTTGYNNGDPYTNSWEELSSSTLKRYAGVVVRIPAAASAGGAPTLSNCQATSITANSITPQVDVTY